MINLLKRNQKKKFLKRRSRIFNKNLKTVLKLGGRGCLNSIPVFSLISIPSLIGSKRLQVQVKGDQVRCWRRNIEWGCCKCLHQITRQCPRHLFPPLKPIAKSRRFKDKWDHREVKGISQSLVTDLKRSPTFHQNSPKGTFL